MNVEKGYFYFIKDEYFEKVLILTFANNVLDKIYYKDDIISTSMFSIFNLRGDASENIFSNLSSKYSFILPTSNTTGAYLPNKYNNLYGNLTSICRQFGQDMTDANTYNATFMNIVAYANRSITSPQSYPYYVLITYAHTSIDFTEVSFSNF